MNLRVLARLIEIQRAIERFGLDEFVRDTRLFRPLRMFVLASPWTWLEKRRGGPRGVRLRLALEELGPIFVKFGQALSTRRDLLPGDIADELAKLQDAVPPFDGRVARLTVERSLGRAVAEIFEHFDEVPLAAASIAQVHAATLRSDAGTALQSRDVVVKVLRPGMRAVIERDLEVLDALATAAFRRSIEARRLRVVEVVDEYRKTVLDELDLMREAANAAQLRRNFAGTDLLYVPEVHWDLCRLDVMVMERIHGIQISNMTALRAAGADIRLLAENGVKIFFTQVFRHNFFHADMHPGNIFVFAQDPARPVYAAVDFGIVGTLDPRDQHYLAENFLAVFDRNYRRVADLHVESGWVPQDTRVDEMESAVRTVLEPIFNKPLREISFGTVLLRLFEISRRFDMRIQPQLVLLQKTLLQVEGLGRDLYPDLDIWQTASPILRQWMSERVSGANVVQTVRDQLPELLGALRVLPPLLKGAVQRAHDGTLRLQVEADNLRSLERTVRRSARRSDATLVGAALLLGGLVWLAVAREPAWIGALCLLTGVVIAVRARSG